MYQQQISAVMKQMPKIILKTINAKSSVVQAQVIEQESPADARVTRDSSPCIPPAWIFEIRKLHH